MLDRLRPSSKPKRLRYSGVALALCASALCASPAAAASALVLTPDPVTLVILLVAFAALILPVNALLFRPLFRVIDERDAQITGTRRRAEQLELEAQQVLQRYDAAVREAREEAEVERRRQVEAARLEQTSIAAEARGEAEREGERARQELGRSLGEARETLRVASTDLGRQAAERILGRAIS